MTFVMSQPSECQVAAFATKLLINDRSVASESGKIFATINPATEVTEGQAHRQPSNASPKVPLGPSLPILIQGCCADPILQHVFRKGPLVDCNRKQKSGKATVFSHAWQCRHRAAARLRPQARYWKAKIMAFVSLKTCASCLKKAVLAAQRLAVRSTSHGGGWI